MQSKDTIYFLEQINNSDTYFFRKVHPVVIE